MVVEESSRLNEDMANAGGLGYQSMLKAARRLTVTSKAIQQSAVFDVGRCDGNKRDSPCVGPSPLVDDHRPVRLLCPNNSKNAECCRVWGTSLSE